jgi:hypothetical protein
MDFLLREVADLDPVAELEVLGDNPFEERRLAGAVRADERDVFTPLERERDVMEQLAARDSHVRVLDVENRSATPLRVAEVEAEPLGAAREKVVLGPDARALLLEARDLRELGLRLLGLRLLVPKARHEPLEAVDVDRDAVGGLRRVGGALGLFPPPGVPRAGEVRCLPGLELEGRVRDRLQEPAVVGDEHDARVERREFSLEPFDVRHVQVVRGLVEEEQVWVSRQGARQRGASQLATRERPQAAVELVVREPEPAHDRCGMVAPAVAARVLEPGLGSRVGGERVGAVVTGRHRGLESSQVLLGRDEVLGAVEDVFPQGQRALERRALVVQRDPRSLLEGELAAVQPGLTGEHPEQGRLARPVGPGESEPVPPFDLEADAVEQRISGELLSQTRGD